MRWASLVVVCAMTRAMWGGESFYELSLTIDRSARVVDVKSFFSRGGK